MAFPDNVIQLHTQQRELARVTALAAVYREALLELCGHADRCHEVILALTDPFRAHEVEKITDRGTMAVERFRAMCE